MSSVTRSSSRHRTAAEVYNVAPAESSSKRRGRKRKTTASTKSRSSSRSSRSPSAKRRATSSKKKKTSGTTSKSTGKGAKKSPNRSAAAKKAAKTRGTGVGSRTTHKNPSIAKIPYKADAAKSPKETHTPQHNPHTEAKRMSHLTSKDKRQADHIEESYEKKGMGSKKAKAIAYATVNKIRAKHGETETSSE